MFKVLNPFLKQCTLKKLNYNNYQKFNIRTFLSQAYYCHEIWEHRLNNPVLQKVNLEELYYELDQRYQKTQQISAVDVDIFANAITNESYVDEVLDLVHKLRLSADTGNMLNSTSHAVIRALTQCGKKEDLLNALDDRLNYGLFLDFYTTNLLLDIYWKNKDFTSGARVASQLMLQEEFDHPLSNSLSLLHCYNYLFGPKDWPQYPKPEEPEEEVKIRVKYIRNPYDDDHFDLRDPNKIVGKTLAMFTNSKNDPLNKSLNILGLVLYNKQNLVKEVIKECTTKNLVLYKEIIDLIPENYESKEEVKSLNTKSADIQNLLKTNVENSVQEMSEGDIAKQCKTYSEWEANRINALEEQRKRRLTAKRLADVEDLKAALKEKETKLWFFDNEEQIELDIETKRVYYPKRWFGKMKTAKNIDEDYVPPEVHAKQTNI
ncbi:hypothetical protein NQ314_008141 [Rhamnusium bicolor]|uniref:Mitochondrial 28S ribosomal protein S27 n=1 Tax=Rhamnusium bicolor TaxID=1586634 RepID=A0AAV8YDF0_9CUCU|nr:hypothetical protein NQ314_008141 [Rhamnusium bicolor]